MKTAPPTPEKKEGGGWGGVPWSIYQLDDLLALNNKGLPTKVPTVFLTTSRLTTNQINKTFPHYRNIGYYSIANRIRQLHGSLTVAPAVIIDVAVDDKGK